MLVAISTIEDFEPKRAIMNTKFKLAIMEAGLSQRDLAKETGIHESLISMAVRGRYVFDGDQKRKIAKELRRPISQIFAD